MGSDLNARHRPRPVHRPMLTPPPPQRPPLVDVKINLPIAAENIRNLHKVIQDLEREEHEKKQHEALKDAYIRGYRPPPISPPTFSPQQMYDSSMYFSGSITPSSLPGPIDSGIWYTGNQSSFMRHGSVESGQTPPPSPPPASPDSEGSLNGQSV